MAAKIIGHVTTLPSAVTTPDGKNLLNLDQWIDHMFTAHDDCSSLWCFCRWCMDVVAAFKKHGVPIPTKGKLPWKEYSLVLVNDLTHMMEAAA